MLKEALQWVAAVMFIILLWTIVYIVAAMPIEWHIIAGMAIDGILFIGLTIVAKCLLFGL